ncbi:helix-turn-helix domain-containing protein [Agromyces sp. ISL-38]|uniref:TetR/AcrR family transcriptional regulator n=1 Tax=Agromyces sp. ISL-38 TaxID=2819107 RepID=UPI0027DF5AB6|nr:helix-turn-helix domain-containing protein [Agromyces sp. ISL-38]
MSRRTYDATRRRQQAARTHARIVEVAGRLFVERGYAGTTIPAIAGEAGVAVETVYRASSGKAGLLADAVRAAVAGGAERADVPITERPAIRRIIEEADPVRQLQLYAATQPGIWSRVGPLLRVLDAAANSDASLVRFREQIVADRRHGLRDGLGQMLEQRGMLSAGVTAERAGDIVYAICGQANYLALVDDCGWTEAAYESWLSETLITALLPRAAADEGD